jgi:hypothetical protein
MGLLKDGESKNYRDIRFICSDGICVFEIESFLILAVHDLGK